MDDLVFACVSSATDAGECMCCKKAAPEITHVMEISIAGNGLRLCDRCAFTLQITIDETLDEW